MLTGSRPFGDGGQPADWSRLLNGMVDRRRDPDELEALQNKLTSIGGQYKCFTSLEAERLFPEYNTRSILAFKRAAES